MRSASGASPSGEAVLAEDYLESPSRHLGYRSRAGGDRALRRSGQRQFDVIDPEYGGLAGGVPSGRERGYELISIEFIGAVVGDDGIAARYPSVRKMNDASAPRRARS